MAPEPDPRSRIVLGRIRMSPRRSSWASRAICAIRTNSGSPSPTRANMRRTAMRSNTGRVACGIDRGSAMDIEYGFASAMRREPAADTARDGCGRRIACSRHSMRIRPTECGDIRCDSCTATSACFATNRAGSSPISATHALGNSLRCVIRAPLAERAPHPMYTCAANARLDTHQSTARFAPLPMRHRSITSSDD